MKSNDGEKKLLYRKNTNGCSDIIRENDLPTLCGKASYDKDMIMPALVHAPFQEFITFHYSEALDYLSGLSMPFQSLGFSNGEWVWKSALAGYVYMYDIALPNDFVESLLRGKKKEDFDPIIDIPARIEARMYDDSIIRNGDKALEAYIDSLRRRRNEIHQVETKRVH